MGIACVIAFLGVAAVSRVVPANAAGISSATDARSENASRISLQVAVGYGNIYRGSNWTPIRVTLRNRTDADLSGLLRIPQSAQSASVGALPAFHGLYQVPVTLPAGTSKHITVYVPGSGIQGRVDASFQQGSSVLASGSAYPTGIDSGTLLIGVLADRPDDYAWVAPAIQQHVTAHVIPLTVSALDPVAQALSTFDIIVLTNVDTSELDAAQFSALEGYVRNGGSLVLVGGPTWQETLRPLPPALLPGKLAGMRVLPNLHGLLSLGAGTNGSTHEATAVSVLTNPTGMVRAGQAGLPLVLRTYDGQGTIEYLAFDPALLPAGSRLLENLVTMAAPLAISRTWSPIGFRARFDAIFRNAALTSELRNVPPTALPWLVIFAGLTVLYVVLLGPANFLLLRRLGRQHFAWITLPGLALVYLGSMFAVATHLKDDTALINTVSLITLNGHTNIQPVTTYLSLFAPLPGNYRLAYDTAALPAALPPLSEAGAFSFRDATTLHSTPLGLELREEPETTVMFLAMKRWASRDVTFNTSVRVPGSVTSNLRIDARGNVAGSIHNGTNLAIRNPVVLAGQSIVRLPDILPGATIGMRVKPTSTTSGPDPTSIWTDLYGAPNQNSDSFGGFGFGDCCDQFSYSEETGLIDRERNAIAMLSQAQALPLSGGILLIGWNRQSLGKFSVGGVTPQERNLNLVVTPLAVHLPSHGTFRLNPGTLTAHLVDVLPRAPQSSCCSGIGAADSTQPISVGTGGSLTFEFDLPHSRHVEFRRLVLDTGRGADSLGPGRVYDWRDQRWVNIDLSIGSAGLPNPNRLISSTGQLLVELRATDTVGDLNISDQYHALDLSGTGRVR